MTIDEAIKHAEEVAQRLENSHKRDLMCEDDERCAKEHRQLAEWLKELKAYREREERAIRNRFPMVQEERMTREEAITIIKNLKNYLRNEDKVKDKKLHEDVYTALDTAIEVMGDKT